MKVLMPVSLLAVLMAAPAFAACTQPNTDITVPDGTKASMDEMVAAKHMIQDSDAATKLFADCLNAEKDAKIAAGGDQMKDEDKRKIGAEYDGRFNTVAQVVQKTADKFNAEVRAWKALHAPPAAAAPSAAPAAQPAKP